MELTCSCKMAGKLAVQRKNWHWNSNQKSWKINQKKHFLNCNGKKLTISHYCVSIHNNAKRKKLGEYSNLHLTLRQERIFICIYAWQVKFFLQFLASGFIYQTTRILFLKMNCLSLNIVLWLPLINFHFFLMNEST